MPVYISTGRWALIMLLSSYTRLKKVYGTYSLENGIKIYLRRLNVKWFLFLAKIRPFLKVEMTQLVGNNGRCK